MPASITTKTSVFVPILFLCLTAGAIVTLPAHAGFPEKRIKIIVPFAPGGGADIIARLLADFMSKDLGKPVIIENKPGAGTIVGTEEAARSAPDGHTLLMTSTPFVINPSIYARRHFQGLRACSLDRAIF